MVPTVEELEKEVHAYQQRVQSIHNAIARNQQELANFSQVLVYKQGQLDLLKAQSEEPPHGGSGKEETAAEQAEQETAGRYARDYITSLRIENAKNNDIAGRIRSAVEVPVD